MIAGPVIANDFHWQHAHNDEEYSLDEGTAVQYQVLVLVVCKALLATSVDQVSYCLGLAAVLPSFPMCRAESGMIE